MNDFAGFSSGTASPPHSTTGIPPVELLLGRRPRSKLDFLKPNLSDTVQSKTDRQKQHDVGTKLRTFRVHDKVYVKDFPNSKQWKPGEIIEVRGPLSYLVELCDGCVVRRHVDALLTRMATDSTESTETPLLDVPDPSLPASESTTVPAVVEAAPPTSVDDTSSDAGPETVNVTPDTPQEQSASPPLQYFGDLLDIDLLLSAMVSVETENLEEVVHS